MWHIDSTPLSGALLLTLPSFKDERGSFIKTFHEPTFRELGIEFELKESYYSFSGAGVIRGMHFQLPPHEHAKIVFCPQGTILDVILDLRKESLTYGQVFAHELSALNHQGFYIPPGFAHGFKALTEGAMTYYLVSSAYSRDHDTGIRFDSMGFDWGQDKPLLSERDLSFPSLKEFESPF